MPIALVHGQDGGETMSRRFVQIPTDAERTSTATFEPAWSDPVRFDVPIASTDPAARPELLGALIALLHRYAEQDEIALDVVVRDASGETRLALDVAAADGTPFATLVETARTALVEATQRVSQFAERQAPSNVAVTFVSEGEADTELDPDGAAYEVHFVVRQSARARVVAVTYDATLLRAATVARLVDSYGVLLAAAQRDPGASVEALPLLGPRELRAVTVEHDGVPASYPPLHAHLLFEARAQAHPSSPAATFQGETLTYGELDARSSQLAHLLAAADVGPGVPVAVCVRPSIDVLVAMLAIWKARGIYLPLDPTHPPALVARMVEEAKPRVVLTVAALAELTDGAPQLCLDVDRARIDAMPSTPPDVGADLADPAYLFYTSGTTGKPKGVLATQGNLAQYVHSAAEKYGFRRSDVFVSLARYTFSISLFELVSPLCCGARVRLLDRDEVLTPERLSTSLHDVTVIHAGPSLLGSLFRYLRVSAGPGAFPGVRHASSGGDMVSPAVMEEMKRVFPNAELFVIYGCTEVACMGTTFPIARDEKATRTFVGKPFPGVTARVLDARRRAVPFGVVGEIAFAGAGIARGYLDRPELTEEKFVSVDGRRFYRTGDMGRLHPDGNLEILGRRDFQVQVRGIRVELAGIEKTALELGLAAQCAVVAKPHEDGDVRLVAYVVKPARDGVAAFRRALGAELPDYMLPHHVVVLEAMPLTVNGKLDWQRLRDMPLTMRPPRPAAGVSADAIERIIAEAFARVLSVGLGQVGAEDSFYDLGGDSLLGVLAMQEIERSTGVKIAPHVFFESGTVAALARYMREGEAPATRPILLNAASGAPPVYMLSGIHVYRQLARRLEGRCTAYGVFVPSEFGALDPRSGAHSDDPAIGPTVEDLARDYVQVIREHQPEGPYRVLGYSFAGIVAYEVAQQLVAAGQEVRFLGMVDAFLPEWTLGWRYRLSQVGRLASSPPRAVAAFVARRWREKRDPFFEELAVYRFDPKIAPLEERRFVVNGEAAARYLRTIRPFAGGASLVLSGQRLERDPLKSATGGWRSYVSSLEVRLVDADHWTLMRADPHLGRTADFLAAGLARG